jgi:hypothetical protein
MNPLYKLAAIALVVLGLAGAVTFAIHRYGNGRYEAGKAEVTAKWDKERAQQAAAALAESQANARETQRRLAAQQESQHEYDAQLAQARRDAAAANAALDGLRKRANQYAAAARRAASNPAAVGNSAPASDAAGVLADVLGKLGGRAQLLAAYADAARRAGKQCERDYDALSATIH